MPITKPIVCPQCDRSDLVEKASTIYLEGIGASRKGTSVRSDGTSSLPRLHKAGLGNADLQALSRKLAPPSSGKSQITRPLHPDLIVIAFSAVLPVFLAGIAGSQRGLLMPTVIVILAFYGVYFWQRGRLVARYEHQLRERQQEILHVKQAIARWMNTYYCARDGVVFEAGKPSWVPVEEMQSMLYEPGEPGS